MPCYDIARCSAIQDCTNIEPLESCWQEAYGRGFAGATANPIPHGKLRNPVFAIGNFAQLAADLGHSHSMFAEIESCGAKGRLRLQHSVSSFLCSSRLGNNDTKSLSQMRANPCQDAVHT